MTYVYTMFNCWDMLCAKGINSLKTTGIITTGTRSGPFYGKFRHIRKLKCTSDLLYYARLCKDDTERLYLYRKFIKRVTFAKVNKEFYFDR